MTQPRFLSGWWFLLALLLGGPGPVQAFPPAPHHLIFGTVRDELGQPLTGNGATLLLETSAGVQIRGVIREGTEPGSNYRLIIPMDSGLTSDRYKPTALQPTVPFRIKVLIGGVTYLPMEMKGSFANLGNPGQRTRLDLTLGEDSDNDGLPDAWERYLLSMLGSGLTLADIKPGDDADKDGLSNLAEYLAGTYAFDPEDGFTLKIVGAGTATAQLEFMAIRGRAYSLYGSDDLKTWRPIPFRVASESPAGQSRQTYQATDVRLMRIDVVPSTEVPPKFFKVRVQ